MRLTPGWSGRLAQDVLGGGPVQLCPHVGFGASRAHAQECVVCRGGQALSPAFSGRRAHGAHGRQLPGAGSPTVGLCGIMGPPLSRTVSCLVADMFSGTERVMSLGSSGPVKLSPRLGYVAFRAHDGAGLLSRLLCPVWFPEVSISSASRRSRRLSSCQRLCLAPLDTQFAAD